jgi:hypothetical protein
MTVAYCDVEDVRTALQESSLSGPVGSSIVSDDVRSVSSWFRRNSQTHFYDSGSSGGIVATTSRTASRVRLDIPSSPHSQHDTLYVDSEGLRYPITTHGPYARIPLPHGYVDSVNTLEVRQRDGSVDDWVALSSKQQGRGEDYYVQIEGGTEGYGRSYLFIRADSITARRNWDGVITSSYSYGLDAANTEWQDVRRGIALLTAAQVVVDDDVLTAIPDNGQLVGVDTQAERLADRGMTYLEPYL